MNKIMRCLVVVVMGIFASMTLIFGTPAFATPVVTVRDSGKSLTSIFEGTESKSPACQLPAAQAPVARNPSEPVAQCAERENHIGQLLSKLLHMRGELRGHR